MKYLFSTFLTLYCLTSLAQKETSNWFFVQNAAAISADGVNTGVPQPDWSTFRSFVTSTSVSDPAGNLLFACGGNTIIDRNLATMPALKDVDFHSGQGTILAQKIPGSSRYLVFYDTANDPAVVNSNWTLKYAVVDLALNGGNGDVIIYDQIVDTALSMGYTLVQGDNTEDAWLVTHRAGTDSFFNYRITATGLGTTPVISKAGSFYRKKDYIFKALKTAHNGKMFAGVAYRDYTDLFASLSQFMEVFNFDAATGAVTSKIRTTQQGYYFNGYLSLEFSPDNRLLYQGQVSSSSGLQPCDFGSGAITQFNLCYTDTTEFTRYAPVVASDYVWCGPGMTWGRIQLGADKRIHIPYSGVTVSTINNPNRIGSSANFLFDSYHFTVPNNGNKATPGFQHRQLEKGVKNNIVYKGSCYPAPVNFQVTNDTITTIQWDFGDPASPVNTVTQKAPAHAFSAPGIYMVTAKLYNSSGKLIETITELVELKDPGKRLLSGYPKDTSICQGRSVKLKLKVINGIFAWYQLGSDGSKNFYQLGDSINVNGGTWYVEMRQNDCDFCRMVDSIHINELPTPGFSLGADRSICKGDSIRLTGVDSTADYLWSTGSTEIGINATSGGTYWVEAEYNNNGCPNRDTVVLTDAPSIRFNLPGDTSLCDNTPLLLTPGIAGAHYFWQDNTYDTSYIVTRTGTYWVNAYSSDYTCYHSDTIIVKYVNAQQVYLGNDTTVCYGTVLTLQPNITNAQYLWSNGSTGSQLTVNATGDYWVTVNNGSCTVADTIHLVFINPPVLFLGKDTALCLKETLTLTPGINNALYRWQDGSAATTFAVTGPGTYWVQVQKDGCTISDSIMVSYYPAEPIQLGPDIRLCAGTDTFITARGNFIQYSWNNGTTGALIKMAVPGNYIVTATSAGNCTIRDTIALLAPFPLPVVQLDHTATICTGETRILNAGNGFAAYLWNNGSTAATRPVNTVGSYSVTVTDYNGCKGTDTVFINRQVPLPADFLPADTALCSYATLSLVPLRSYTEYLWNTNATTAAITVTKAGIYTLTVTDQYHCRGTDQVVITPKDCMQGLFVPTAFSPDNNGLNDVFKPQLFGAILQYEFIVYNRFGQVIFRSSKPGEGWDGSYKGTPQPGGAYLWTCGYRLENQLQKFAKGAVLIVR